MIVFQQEARILNLETNPSENNIDETKQDLAPGEEMRSVGHQYILSEKEYWHPFLNVNVPLKPSVEGFVNDIWEIKTRHNKLETESFVNFADINKKIRYIAYATMLNSIALCLYGVSYIIEWFR